MAKHYTFLIIVLLSTCTNLFAQDWKSYPYSPEATFISFPIDEGRHVSEPVEWWYTVGHVTGKTTGTNYSYMLTYFYYNYPPYDGFRILNVSNDDTGEFYDDTQPVKYATLATDSLNILAKTGIFSTGTETWKNKTDAGGMIPYEYVISAAATNGALNLEYISVKRPLILGGDGKFNQGASSYTYYYSQTKNLVSGTLTFKGSSEQVEGTSWIDRQYGTIDPNSKEKYEWLSIQLSNDMDINVYALFTLDNKLPKTEEYNHMAVYVSESSQYSTVDFELERLEFEFSADNAACYSQKWRLTSPTNNIDLIISTLHANSEVHVPFRFYEGATNITGTVNGSAVTGIGFAELLHNYEHPDVSVSQPMDNIWDKSLPITWVVNNKDQARPLMYDLEYSTNNKVSFSSIAIGINDTSYLWENVPLNNGSECWFKVTAYSIDNTLWGEAINSEPVTVAGLTTIHKATTNAKPDINIYPNPAGSHISVNVSGNKTISYYQIVDISGKTVLSSTFEPVSDLEINTADFTKGVYFFKSSIQERLTTSKFLIK